MSPLSPQRRVYVETYGCQMNVADSEVVAGILKAEGYAFTSEISEADVVFVNTCAIRENAEERIYGRLGLFSTYKRENPLLVVGVLGCMAERLRTNLLERDLIDLVVGPDEYRKLPELVEGAIGGAKGVAVRLSRVENYDDITPFRAEGVCAWISVMRGCDKFCTFCVVPFTRGRERSRTLGSVVAEVRTLSDQGFKEITLLGQNVNSYRDGQFEFADLMLAIAAVDSSIRVRFTTSHPQDMSDRLIASIAETSNICKHIHLPVQSGSDRILRLMNRTYTVDEYRQLVDRIRKSIPGVSLTTDIISGFPTETETEHLMTIDLLREIRFDGAFTFKYSPREKTKAWEMGDNIPDGEKGRRVWDITGLQHEISGERNRLLVGSTLPVLVEGPSRKSARDFTGRTDDNRNVVFPHADEQQGDLLDVRIERSNSATLFGVINRATVRRSAEPYQEDAA
jgi:tRNA-2-methylthio-N6-dimethylallyladenosine synthase